MELELIKTKLGNDTRQLITNEATIEEIINQLRTEIKTETSDTLGMKFYFIRENPV